jgi:hypothetical protein
VSKGGISSSIGFRGFHINIGKHGIRQTIGLPGSGLSATSYIAKNDDDDDKDREAAARRKRESDEGPGERERPREDDDPEGCSCWVVLFVFILLLGLLYWAGSALGWIPPHLLSGLLKSVADWVLQAGH